MGQEWIIPAILWLPCVIIFAISGGRWSNSINDGKVPLLDTLLFSCSLLLLFVPFLLAIVPTTRIFSSFLSLSFFLKLGLLLLFTSGYMWLSGYSIVQRQKATKVDNESEDMDVYI